MKKMIKSLMNKAICAAFVVLGAMSVCADVITNDLYDAVNTDVKVGYKISGLNDGKEEAVVFTKHSYGITWNAPGNLNNVEYLIVGGGGGGGKASGAGDRSGGGGGAGGFKEGQINAVYRSSLSISVGAGGPEGSSGVDSSITGDSIQLIAYGGGAGGFGWTAAKSGGSGGGGLAAKGAGGSVKVVGEGNAGGAGGIISGNNNVGGGGGGAGGAGVSGPNGGTGGAGKISSITGEEIYYAAGGGGGSRYNTYQALGGIGSNGGGYGGKGNSGGAAKNYGCGGGGSSYNRGKTGGSGYQGIVVLRYAYNFKAGDNYYLDFASAANNVAANGTIEILNNDEASGSLDKSIVLEIKEGVSYTGTITLTAANAVLTANKDVNVVSGVQDYEVVKGAVENGVYTYSLQVSNRTVTLPEVTGAMWYYEGKAVENNIISVLNGTAVTVTLKANEGYIFADNAGEITINLGSVSENITVNDTQYTAPAERQPSGKFDSLITSLVSGRYGLQCEFQNLYARKSVVFKVYDAEGNQLTETSYKKAFPITGSYTCSIVISGSASSSWTTEVKSELTVGNMPAKGELWIDDVLVYTTNSALADKYAKVYCGYDFVYKEASIGEMLYATLDAAVEAAGAGAEVVLLADVSADLSLNKSVTLQLADGVAYTGTITLTAADAVLTAPAGLTVVTTVANSEVKFENGAYTVVEAAPAALTYAQFNELIRNAAGGVYDGNGITVTLKDSERSYQNNKTAQFFVGATNVNITDPVETVKVSNVNFVFEDDDTDNAYTSGELQVFATYIEFTGCTFNGVAVSPWGKSNSENAETATFTNCTWKDLSGRYGIHQNRASYLTVTNCKFENCERGIHTNSSTVKSIVITGNTFTGIGDGYGVLCLAESNGDLSKATLNIADNVAEGQVMLRQLSSTVTYEQVTAILDTTKNTYGTAYVSGSVEPKPPVAKIGSAKYASLQAAISAVKNGETITLVDNITENVTVTETVGLYYTIDGAGKTMNGTISVNALSDTNDNRRITIKNINFVDATDANVDFISSVNTNHYPRITVEGCTFTGSGDNGDVAVRLKSSHSVVIKDCTGTGLHSFLQNTSGWNLTIEKVTVTDSKSGLALGTVQGVTISGCNIDVAGYGIRLDAQYNNNAVLESNTVSAFIPVVVRKAEVESSVTVSGSNTMTPSNTDNLWFAAGTSEYEANGAMPTAPTGKVVVTLNDANLPASGVYGNYGVAMVNGVKYVTLKDAVAAVADGGVIMLIANETFTEANRTSSGGSWYEGLYYIGDKSFTINLNGFTITQNGAVNDYLMLFKNEGSKANAITLQNGTMDAGSTAYCAICTSSASTQKIIVNLENVNVIGNNYNGSVLKIRGGTELNVKAGTKITGKNSYLGIECVASTVNIYDGAEIYMNGTGSYNGCLVGACGGGVVNVYGGYGKGVKGGFIAMTSGGTINVSGGEWIANNDGTVGDNSNLYVLTAQNNKNENGYVGASVINVTGGTFRGGMDAWVLNNANGEKAELNIAGGNFNANPTAYLDEGYVVNEVSGVYTVAKAVAKIGAGYYTNLVDAFKAATEGCTIEILSDVTIDYKWDCRDYATGGSHSQFKESVTINGNGHTLKFTGTVNDSNWNTIFRFEENATVNNLTVDISEATGAQRVISAKKSLTVDGLTVVGSAKYGIIFGEGASAADLAAAEIVVKNSTLTGTRRAISDNEGGKDVKSVAITDNTLNANVYASASESIIFNNNTAAGEVDLRSYTAENVLSVEAKGNTLTEGVKNYIYAKNIDAQEGFTAERVPTTVSTYEQLIAALAEDNAYVVLANDITATATQSSGYGKAGIVVEAGDVLDGNDKTLTINGANATWDCAIAMRGGEVKNLTIAGAMRGVFMPGANGDVVIDNCKFQDVIYTFNSDGGSKDYTVTIKNTELNGWTSFSDVHKSVTFENCLFAKGNGYAFCRPYQATIFNNCSFSGDFEIDCSQANDNKLAFNDCTYNDQAITSENAFDLFGDGAKVLVNGAPADYTKVAQVGGQIYSDLQEAIKAAAPDGTVTLLKDVVVDEWKMVTEDYNIASGELITLTMNGLTIDGNDKTLTVKAIESAGNGGYLFQGASSLTVKDLTINQPAGMGGIALKAGTIENVTFNGGKYAVLPGSGDVIVKDCTFNDITGYAVYFEEDRDNLEITGNTFNCADSAYAVTLRGGADFTNNTVNTGRVNLADSASGTVSGNNFGMERFKVYNGATATIENNTINNLVFNDANVPQNSTFTGNTLSTEAQAVLDAMNFVAKVGDNYYTSINAALAAAQDGDAVYVFAGDYTQDLVIDKDITVIGETTDTGYQLAAIWGQLQITADGATVKGFYVYDDDTAAYVNAKDVLIEGCELVGAGWAGLYQSYTDGTVTFKDSTIVGYTYGINFDGSDGGNIIIDNCKIQGWTSFASTINNVAISDSEFAEGYYNQLRFYQNAQLTNVTFNENMTIDFGKDDVDASFSDCSVENGGSLLDVIYLDDIHNMGVDVTIDDAPVVLVAKIGDKYYTTLQAALDAAAAGTGNVTVEILSDIDLTGTAWDPVTVSAPGYPFVTVNGNGKTITGLNDMLFAGTWAGKSGLVINDLTIADSTIVNDENDSKGTVGVGAFVGYPQASATVTLNNCHLKDSTVKGGHWTGGLVGIAGGYNGTDGPVFMTLTIDGCSVTGSTITGKGSAGGIIGHGSCSAWTDVIIVNSTVSNNIITSTGSSTNKAGSVMGTIGAAGQPTTVNGVEKTGGMSVSVTTAGNTVKSADKVITTIYGRQGTETGLLEIAGGTYEAYPIEENVEYAAPKDGYIIFENADGKYGVKEGTYVAQINGVKYETLASALAAAQNDAVVELLWAEGNAPIAMNGSVYGDKTVTITGTAEVDWSKGWLFVGRGGEGDGTVIFDNAKLTSSEASLKNGSYGIHVSAPEKGSTSKCNGTVIIQNNSDIQLSYLANRHNVTVDNSRLYVEYGFWVGGRPANETPDSQPGIANMELVNNSTVTVKNHNGMGVGHESVGNLAIEAGSTFEYLNDAGLRVKANSSLVSAGNFFGKIAAESDAHIEISGGVYTQDVNEWCVEGCAALPDLNGKYVVGVKPTATVNNLGMVTVPAGDYMVYGGGSNGNDMPLSFVMQFLADQTEADMATSPYADWYGDFVITFTGIKDDSFTADGCYLAGHYGDFGWVKVPVDGMTIENGVRYPVMLGVGMGQKYEYICSGVKDFMCAMYLTPEILSANPNLQVKLELAVVDNANGEDAATSALVNNEKVFSVVDYEYTVDDFTILEKTYEVGAGKAFATMNEAIAQAKADGADVVTYTVYGAVTLETGYAHGTVDFGVTDGVTVVGGDADAKMTITGGGVPDIKGVAFKDITLDDAGEYLPTANEFMYQNYVDCTFENVTFLEGPRVSGVSTMTGCTIHQSKSDQYALWLDEGEFTMTGSTVAVSGEGYGMVKSDAVGKITLTDNTFTYQNAANKEALNVKGASIAATGNTFIDCTEGILPADKINYGQDGSTVIDDDAMIAGGNTVKNSVATVGGNKYLTLAGAVEAAQPGDTVTLIADVSEDVTIKKSLTIDGAKSDTEQFKYTGTMSINTSLDVAIQNVNFDKGSISEAKGTRGTLTIKNCTFDGVDKSIGYAITVRGADKLVIENTAAKNYGYGMLYIPSSVAAIAVKDVTVSDVTSAFNIAYSGDGVFENVSVKNATYGLNAHNYGARTFVMKNWTLENVGMMTRVQEKATATVTFDMQGLYDISKLSASQYAKHIADATTGNVIGTLQPVIAAAADGGTVTLSRDIITITEDDCVPGTDHKVLVDVVGKDITLDMNGKTIFVDHKERDTDYIVAAIRVADGAGLTVTGNGTVDVAAHDENPCIYYMFWKRGASGHLTVENGTYHMNNAEDSMVYANAGETVTVNGGTWTLDTYGTRNNRHPWIFNVSGQDDNYITVNGGTFNADINDQYYWYEVRVSLDKALRDNGDGTWTVVNAVAYVENQYWDGKKGKPIGYATLADAVADVDPGKTITLLKNIELSSYLPIEKSLALDLGEFTITRNGGSGVLYVNGSEAEVTINGTTGGITGSQTVWTNAGTVTINGGTFNGVGGEAVYATGTGKVVINGGTFSSNIEGFVVNQHDSARDTSSIVINGGTFVGFDPRNNAAETAGTTFMGEGKYTFAEGGNYIVVTPEDYILNDVSSDSATVNEIDSLLAGAVTVIKDGEKYVATATYTFKVTAVDTVNPEKSEYELTGGTLRPGKSVKVKYIDLVTGTESWDKPEADTVTFKLVIK